MGRRGGTETLSVVLLAFLERRTWRQADLVERSGVERKTLVRLLTDLHHAGLPLVRDADPPQVYWSVPKTWFPGSVAFQGQDVVELVRLIQRTPRSEKRDRLLTQITTSATGTQGMIRGDAILTRTLSSEEEARLSALQESVEQSLALHVQYFTLSRGDVAWRHLSVHRVVVESARVIATCHRDGKLKWFRLDGILSARLDRREPRRSASDSQIQELLDESVDGYHSGGPPIRCVFRVRLPDARWLRGQLPLPLHADQDGDFVVFTAVTAGLLPLARLIVGLGDAATVETPELRHLVQQLARGALEANQ